MKKQQSNTEYKNKYCLDVWFCCEICYAVNEHMPHLKFFPCALKTIGIFCCLALLEEKKSHFNDYLMKSGCLNTKI